MKTIYMMMAVILTCLILSGCPQPPMPGPPTTTTTLPDMLCETQPQQCNDGSYPQICVNFDQLTCGVIVKGLFYECADCEGLDYDGCEDAMDSSARACLGEL